MVSAAYPVAFYVFFFSFTFFILTQSHENSSLNSINFVPPFCLFMYVAGRAGNNFSLIARAGYIAFI